MEGLVKRPDAAVTPGPGLLCKDQFQVGYVTNDMDRACQVLAERYGVAKFSFIEGPMANGGEIKAAFAWVGKTLYEIIAAKGPGTEFYNEALPAGEFAIRFHHLGFLIHDRGRWEALEREFVAEGRAIAFATLTGDFMDAYYVKAPELGHYLEYMYPYQTGIDFLAAVPVS